MKTTRTSKQADKKSSGKRWTIVSVLVLLLLSATVAWAMRSGEDPQITHIRQMRAEIEALPREQQREKWGEMREEFEKLTEEQRDVLFADRRAEWQAREKKELKEFFAMTKEQQIAQLDKDIDRMKEWKNRANRRGGDRGGWGRGGGGRGGRGGTRPQNFGRDASGNIGASDRTKRYLNHSDGATRGARYEYRRMLNDRIRERGGV